MPLQSQVIVTSSQTWTVPDGIYRIDVVVDGPGGAGAASNPVTETPGGGGGQGGQSAVSNLFVQPGQQFLVGVYGNYVVFLKAPDYQAMLQSLTGDPANGATGGAGGGAYQIGWGSCPTYSANGTGGQNALSNGVGGNGGGSPGNHGSPTVAAGNGFAPRGGGGGMGFNGPGSPGSGAPGRVTILLYTPDPV